MSNFFQISRILSSILIFSFRINASDPHAEQALINEACAKLYNGRAIPIYNKTFIAFANPDNRKWAKAFKEGWLKSLKDAGVNYIIKLRKTEKREEGTTYVSAAKEEGITVKTIEITDYFSTETILKNFIPPEIYNKIYDRVTKISDNCIGIHCGAGLGRTGTALAALWLKQSGGKPNLNSTEIRVRSSGNGKFKNYPVYENVEEAINYIRGYDYDIVNPENFRVSDKYSIETFNDARTLNVYFSCLGGLGGLSINSKPDQILSAINKNGMVVDSERGGGNPGITSEGRATPDKGDDEKSTNSNPEKSEGMENPGELGNNGPEGDNPASSSINPPSDLTDGNSGGLEGGVNSDRFGPEVENFVSFSGSNKGERKKGPVRAEIIRSEPRLMAFSSSSLAGEKQQQNSSSSLRKKINTLKSEIEDAHNKRNVESLLKLTSTFDEWKYPDKKWKKQAKELKIEQWPNQSWKQGMGGHLFYPEYQVAHFLSSDFTSHLIKRRDIVWSFAIASRYKHPLAQYHLALIVDNLHEEHSFGPRSPLINSLYEESLNNLEKCLHIPQACYIVASNYAFDASKVGKRDLNLKRSLEIHEKGAKHNSAAGYHNRVALLVKISLYPSLNLSLPKRKDYISVGKYGPAYVHAASLSKKSKKKEELLKEAATYHFPQAYVHLGALYEEEGRIEEALNCYKEAGKARVPRGYILLSHRLVGDQTSRYEAPQDFTKFSQEDLGRSIYYLKKAGEGGDFEAWDQLIGLYRHLYDHSNREDYFIGLRSALENGLQMGSSYAYLQAQSMFSSRKYKEITSFYGSPCQEEAIQYASEKLNVNN